MRVRLLVAGLTIALTVTSAQAQVGMPGGARIGDQASDAGRRQEAAKAEALKPKVDEKAYSSALRNIPEKQYDPWRGVR